MMLSTDPGTGVVRFLTDPVGALIYLDGEEYSVITPATINNIPVGEHDYVLRKEGQADYIGKITVEDGSLCCADINMSTVKETEQCSTEIVPLPYITAPRPDYGMLIIGLFAGLIFAGMIREDRKK